MIWLDWLLFGNGYGMASPYFDDAFFWLHDFNCGDRNTKGKGGRFYRWVGGFGAQLDSIEWSVPLPGTRRHLIGEDFVVFQARRHLCRVRVSWALARGIQTPEQLRELKTRLLKWGHGR